ncbi:RNA polymerase sigma-I factor [Gottfriedia sp. NPDC056225]|uniref:RNA polymerase sigma-I factor n=1 Tax=Gottfriedia sp. NPDC056225 TaxID=3345751 RepID=UPI001C208AC1
MLLTIFQTLYKRKEKIEDIVLTIQQSSSKELDDFIIQYSPFISKTVSTICGRYITNQEDEYSIGLSAFHEAIKLYSYKKGASFLTFAKLIIKRELIDYFRKESKYQLLTLEQNGSENIHKQYDDHVYSSYIKNFDEINRKEEIIHFSEMLKQFGITLETLVEVSPKHEDTREHIFSVVDIIASDEEMLAFLYKKKKLPMNKLETKVNISRKTLDKHRKYIIAMCIISVNDYIYLQNYLKRGN